MHESPSYIPQGLVVKSAPLDLGIADAPPALLLLRGGTRERVAFRLGAVSEGGDPLPSAAAPAYRAGGTLCFAVMDEMAASPQRAVEALSDDAIRGTLYRFAMSLMAAEGDAEDLLAEAVAHVCLPDAPRPWLPGHGSFATHMRLVLRDLARRHRRSARARREVLDATLTVEDEIVDPGGEPDDALAAVRSAERQRRLGARLRERLAGKPVAARVLDGAAEGLEGPAELARHLGCPVEAVHEAKRQIAREGVRVLEEERREETARMRALRERANQRGGAT